MNRRKFSFGAALALLATAPVQAEVVLNDVVDANFSVFVSCANGGAGEVVQVSGPLHTLIRYTINGTNVSGGGHFQPQGMSGVGLTTGTKYQATGVTQDAFKGSLQNGQLNGTFINNFRFIGQGPNNNFLVHENYHFTINANGIVTSVHDNLSASCK